MPGLRAARTGAAGAGKLSAVNLPTPPRRILLVKPSAIGDVVLTLPVLRLLRTRFPDAHISWLLTPACAGLLQGHPLLDEVILFERSRFGKNALSLSTWRELSAFTRDLAAKKFDLVIDLQGLFRSGWLTWKTGAPVRVGFANARELAWLGYTHHVRVDSMEQHALERYLTVAEALGCTRSPVEFVFATDDADRAHARQLVGAAEQYAVLLPGANWRTKQWPPARFAALVEPIRNRFGLRCVVAGGPEVSELARSIPALDLCGRTTLRQLTALLEGASLVITNDSGPMHIAAALGRPMVALFGPTNPVRTGPYHRDESVLRIDIPCSPCYARECSHKSCLMWLETDQVLQRCEVQLQLAAR